jgi:hypothetical protein
MAPGKQSVLPSAFFKNRKEKTVNKHQKLERHAAGLPTTRRIEPKVDKKKAAELKREKVVANFSAGWRRYLHEKGVLMPTQLARTCFTTLMALVLPNAQLNTVKITTVTNSLVIAMTATLCLHCFGTN